MSAVPPLTDAEHAVIEGLGQIWNQLCSIVGDGPTREGDLNEAIHHVHALQHMVMANAAARAYPATYRALGATL